LRAIEFILDTLAHFVRGDEGPPPGIPAHVATEFEQELTWLCEWHSVTPIVRASLDKLALRPEISRLTRERIKALADAGSKLSGELLATAKSLMADLERAGAHALLMKDALYPIAVYPAPPLRPVEKLEILIGESDWATVIGICDAAGFAREAHAPVFADGGEAMSFYQYFSHCVLYNEKRDPLRVRFRLFDPGTPDPLEACWGHRTRLGGGNGPMGVSLEDQLVESCMTYNMSHFDRLIHAVDIGLVLVRHGAALNWEYVGERLRSRSVYAAAVFTMQHVVRTLKLAPSIVQLKTPGIIRKNVFLFLWPATDEDLVAGRQPRQQRLRFYLLELDGWPGRLRFIARLLSPREQWVSDFFGRPFTPWLKLKFIVLALRNRLGVRAS
jgi:hypothetical protein